MRWRGRGGGKVGGSGNAVTDPANSASCVLGIRGSVQQPSLCKEPGTHTRSWSLQPRVMQGGAGTGARLHRRWSGKASSKETDWAVERKGARSCLQTQPGSRRGSRAARAQ